MRFVEGQFLGEVPELIVTIVMHRQPRSAERDTRKEVGYDAYTQRHVHRWACQIPVPRSQTLRF